MSRQIIVPRLAMHVFTYGTLQAPAVWLRVAGKQFTTTPGVAHGYRRRCVRGEDYPAIVKHTGDTTSGLVYQGVDQATLVRLDLFEGEQYVRCPIEVQLDTGVVCGCEAYLLSDAALELWTDEPWSLEQFLAGPAFGRFTQNYLGFKGLEP